MSQIVKRKVTAETRAGQYMCPECGKIFETKKEVDSHRRQRHRTKTATLRNHLSGFYTE